MSSSTAMSLPESIRAVHAMDDELGRQVEADFRRVAQVATALAWARERLPAIMQVEGYAGRLEFLVDQARALTSAPVVWALLLEQVGDHYSYEAMAGNGGSIPAPSMLSQTIIGWVLENKRPAWSDDALQDARFIQSQSVQAFALRSVGCLPVGERGLLFLHDPQNPGIFNIEMRTRLMALCQLLGDLLGSKPSTSQPCELPDFIGTSPAVQQLARSVRAFSGTPWPVLVLGETGTGKELVARSLHALSPRCSSPFVPVNCGAIPGELAESLLFGHVRGAFTSAVRNQSGLLDEVGEGTLFLDEIGDLPPALQVKLLRVLQEGLYRPLGSRKTQTFRGRVVAATHRDLLVSESSFRSDLFYRLASCVIRVPPLRERMSDLDLLADHLLARAAEGLALQSIPQLGVQSRALLRGQAWPGNVRELENQLRAGLAYAISYGDSSIEPHHLQPGVSPEPSSAGGDETLEDATRRFQSVYVRQVLRQCQGNRSRAARTLGVSRQWLYQLLSRLEIS